MFGENNKICMITGSNAGLGRESTIQLAKKGFHIVMVCRNRERAERARKEIIVASNNENVDLLIADFASLKSVRNVAEEFKIKYDKLHVIMNNAGVFNYERVLTEDDFESTFGVGYLSHFLLTNLLLDVIVNSAPSRIINISSNIHKFFKIRMDDLMSEKKYSPQKAYSNTKFALVLFTYALARRLEGKKVSVNAAAPGYAKTQMTTPTSKASKIVMVIQSFLGRGGSVEEAAKTQIYLAHSSEVEGISGKYFVKCEPAKSHKMTYDRALQEELWDESEKFVNLY